jgi:GLPGLI family protein
MKRIFLTLAIALITCVSANAQLTEGHVKYDITMSSDNPEMEMAVQMMQGSTLELFFSDQKTRSEMSMGSMMKMVTLTDSKTEEMLMLMSGMMGNSAIKSTFAEIEEESGETPEVEVELLEETKTIEGYLCKKALVTDSEGNEMIFWVTEEIQVNKQGQSYLNEKVPGFPLEFEINQGGLLMSLLVTTFEKKIKDSKAIFDMSIPEGYKEMTMEELKTMGM